MHRSPPLIPPEGGGGIAGETLARGYKQKSDGIDATTFLFYIDLNPTPDPSPARGGELWEVIPPLRGEGN